MNIEYIFLEYLAPKNKVRVSFRLFENIFLMKFFEIPNVTLKTRLTYSKNTKI